MRQRHLMRKVSAVCVLSKNMQTPGNGAEFLIKLGLQLHGQLLSVSTFIFLETHFLFKLHEKNMGGWL